LRYNIKYNVNKLVYFEETNDVTTALAREKEIKKWNLLKKESTGHENE
jgi:putative endonuclease